MIANKPRQLSPLPVEICSLLLILMAAIFCLIYEARTKVMIECAGLLIFALCPASQKLNGTTASERLRTTTAILPSGFKNAVVSSLSVVDELMIRLAPGRMNLENWPM
jgi:hypothetical protein